MLSALADLTALIVQGCHGDTWLVLFNVEIVQWCTSLSFFGGFAAAETRWKVAAESNDHNED